MSRRGQGGRGTMAALVFLVVAAPVHLTAQCPDGSPPPCRRAGVALDTARYVILPFAHREGTATAALDGADCAELLTEAFERWTDVRLADKTRVYDALARRRSGAPFRIPFDAGLEIARRLGAGKLVMGQLWAFEGTLRLTASLYDAARGGPPLREAKARVPAQAGHVGAAFNALADSLLGVLVEAAGGAGAEQTSSLRALTANNAGVRAVRAWDLAGGARHFRAAIAADSAFAHAYLWLGQTLLWAADSSPQAAWDRGAIARRATDLLPRLGATDRALLLAQQAMFERRWPDACTRYREILAADSTSFAAWYGLAECNAGDPVVIRDARDTTRYVFRGSWHTAVQAYRRALLLAPSFNLTSEGRFVLERLPRLLLAERWFWRGGRYGDEAYWAFPELQADTFAFYAVPGAVAAHGNAEPASHGAAVAKSRRILLEIVTPFLDAFPDAPATHRLLGRYLELSGRLVPAVGEPRSALDELTAAQRLERRPADRARDAADRVRLLVKAGEFAPARRLGDSLLHAVRSPTVGLAGVAVLLGRPSLAGRLLALDDTAGLPSSADNQPARSPLPAAQAGLRLLAYAAVGAPRESIAAYERRVAESISGSPAASRARVRSALLDVPAQLVFDELGLRPAHRAGPPGPSWAMAMQWALGHGDTALVRAHLDSLLAERGGRPYAGDATPDGVYLTARLFLAVGDTATAARALDAPLDSLVAAPTALLRYLPLPGALVRMMALRAELAAARGERDVARRWAGAVVALWSGAEPALQPTVARMRRILEGTK